MSVSIKAQHDELKREIKMRQSVYPRWVSAGRIDAAVAAHRIDCLVEILRQFEKAHGLTKPAQTTLL